MDNITASVAETFIPPRSDMTAQKNNPAQSRNRQDFTSVENNPVDRPKRSSDVSSGQDSSDQVSSGDKGDRKDFNEVLEKKIGKKDKPVEKTEVEATDQAPTDEVAPVNVPETATPLKLVNNEIVPLVEKTQQGENGQLQTDTPAVIDAVAKKPVAEVLPQSKEAEQIVTPVEKILANVEGEKTETAGIPIKTIENAPAVNKASVDLTEVASSKAKAEQPEVKMEVTQQQTAQPETEQSVLKTQNAQEGEEVLELSKPAENLQGQTEKTKLQSVGAEKIDFQNKFDRTTDTAKQPLTTENTAPNIETDAVQNKNSASQIVDSLKGQATKLSSKESPAETRTDVTAAATNVQDVNSAGSADGRVDIKPVSSNSIVNQVTEQIRGSVVNGREQVSIALDPPELGRVMIRFQQKNGEIVGIIEADKARTHQEIAEEMPVIIKSLNESGVAVKRVEVVLTEQNTEDALSEKSPEQNNNTGRENLDDSSDNSSNQNGQGRASNFANRYNPPKNADNYANMSNDEAINMYA